MQHFPKMKRIEQKNLSRKLIKDYAKKRAPSDE